MISKGKSWLRTSALALLGLGIAYSAQSFTEKEEVKPIKTVRLTTTMWFSVDASSASDPNNPSNSEQKVTAQLSSSPSAPCTQPSGELCARQLTYDENDTDIQNLLDRVEAGDDIPTIQEFVAAGASAGATSHKP